MIIKGWGSGLCQFIDLIKEFLDPSAQFGVGGKVKQHEKSWHFKSKGRAKMSDPQLHTTSTFFFAYFGDIPWFRTGTRNFNRKD